MVKCKICGKKMKAKAISRRRKFCSDKCYKENQKNYMREYMRARYKTENTKPIGRPRGKAKVKPQGRPRGRPPKQKSWFGKIVEILFG